MIGRRSTSARAERDEKIEARRRIAAAGVARRDARRTAQEARLQVRRGGSQPPLPVTLAPGRGVRPAERPAHRLSTAHLQAAYPAMAEAGLGAMGVYIGRDQHGGSFVFDPWWLYQLQGLPDANTVILGQLRNGKSALIKTYLWRQMVFGRIAEVLDPKGEYDPLIAAMGGVSLTLRPGGTLQVNPLARAIDRDGDDEASRDDHTRRQGVLEAVVKAVLERPLRPVEAVALAKALELADHHVDGEVDVTHVIEQLRSPHKDLWGMLAMDKARTIEETRDAMLALEQLRTGPMAGMFNGPTNAPGHVWDSPALSVNLSALKAGAAGSDRALAIAMMATGSVLDAKRMQRAVAARARGREPDKAIRVNDEFWRALAIFGVGEQEQAAFKLSRTSGVQYIRAMHRLTDLKAAGDEGTRVQALAEGLAEDCSTFIIYRQKARDAVRTMEQLELTATEGRRITRLKRGEALWRVGSSTFLVQHVLGEMEIPLVDTDQAMLQAGPGEAGFDPEEEDFREEMAAEAVEEFEELLHEHEPEHEDAPATEAESAAAEAASRELVTEGDEW